MCPKSMGTFLAVLYYDEEFPFLVSGGIVSYGSFLFASPFLCKKVSILITSTFSLSVYSPVSSFSVRTRVL